MNGSEHYGGDERVKTVGTEIEARSNRERPNLKYLREKEIRHLSSDIKPRSLAQEAIVLPSKPQRIIFKDGFNYKT